MAVLLPLSAAVARFVRLAGQKRCARCKRLAACMLCGPAHAGMRPEALAVCLLLVLACALAMAPPRAVAAPVYTVYFHTNLEQPRECEVRKVRATSVRLCDMSEDSGVPGELVLGGGGPKGHYAVYRNAGAHCLYYVCATEQKVYPLPASEAARVASDATCARAALLAGVETRDSFQLHAYRYYALHEHSLGPAWVCSVCGYRCAGSVGGARSGYVKLGGLLYRRTGAGTAALVGSAAMQMRTLTVPAAVTVDGARYRVTSIGASAFARSRALRHVKGAASVRSIGKKAFWGCGRLRTVRIRSSGLARMGVAAFGRCGALRRFACSTKKLPRRMLVRAGLL